MAPGAGDENDAVCQSPFQLEKILTISAEAYCQSRNTQLTDYNLVGIHFWRSIESHKIPYEISLFKMFAAAVPLHTEAVVGFVPQLSVGTYHACYSSSGTALIPKLLKYLTDKEERK